MSQPDSRPEHNPLHRDPFGPNAHADAGAETLDSFFEELLADPFADAGSDQLYAASNEEALELSHGGESAGDDETTAPLALLGKIARENPATNVSPDLPSWEQSPDQSKLTDELPSAAWGEAAPPPRRSIVIPRPRFTTQTFTQEDAVAIAEASVNPSSIDHALQPPVAIAVVPFAPAVLTLADPISFESVERVVVPLPQIPQHASPAAGLAAAEHSQELGVPEPARADVTILGEPPQELPAPGPVMSILEPELSVETGVDFAAVIAAQAQRTFAEESFFEDIEETDELLTEPTDLISADDTLIPDPSEFFAGVLGSGVTSFVPLFVPTFNDTSPDEMSLNEPAFDDSLLHESLSPDSSLSDSLLTLPLQSRYQALHEASFYASLDDASHEFDELAPVAIPEPDVFLSEVTLSQDAGTSFEPVPLQLAALPDPLPIPDPSEFLIVPVALETTATVEAAPNPLEMAIPEPEFFAVMNPTVTAAEGPAIAQPAESLLELSEILEPELPSWPDNAWRPQTQELDEVLASLDASLEVKAATPGSGVTAPNNVKSVPEEIHTCIVFRLLDSSYGIKVGSVLEMDTLPVVTPLPNVPEFVAGVTNRRGEILPVINLRTMLGLPAEAGTERRRILVVRTSKGDQSAVLLVDEVRGTREVPFGGLERPKEQLADPILPLLYGVSVQADGILNVLSVDRLFEVSEVQALRN